VDLNLAILQRNGGKPTTFCLGVSCIQYVCTYNLANLWHSTGTCNFAIRIRIHIRIVQIQSNLYIKAVTLYQVPKNTSKIILTF